ncbi:uncharacterized protein LOC112567772 isoform X2 [Pomacea canaliculata]|uniref:uncharacterized protein LOC112567772 isoform X2 n=1 Tax=Pomacea canaliculata TaxID=400727 RepID=UPI000D733248|nr:uncharacterized protein LOC112567772 isoform X2 [Pomacea canaliculata]
MVSLANNSRHSGGTFFSDDSTTIQPDDDPLLGSMPVLPQDCVVNQWMAEEVKTFHGIKTPIAIILAKVLYICLGVAANVLPVLCQYKQCGDQETSLILYIHGATWFLLVAIHYFLYVEHQNSLLRGYFNFHLETRNLRHISLHINSAANAVLLVVTKLLDEVCDKNGTCHFLNKTRYLQIIISVEVLVALVFLLIYLVKTMHFNRAKEAPDFMKSTLDSSLPSTQQEVGYKVCFDLKSQALQQGWHEIYMLRLRFCTLLLERKNLLNHAKKPHR